MVSRFFRGVSLEEIGSIGRHDTRDEANDLISFSVFFAGQREHFRQSDRKCEKNVYFI